jgi:hypothetical protein
MTARLFISATISGKPEELPGLDHLVPSLKQALQAGLESLSPSLKCEEPVIEEDIFTSGEERRIVSVLVAGDVRNLNHQDLEVQIHAVLNTWLTSHLPSLKAEPVCIENDVFAGIVDASKAKLNLGAWAFDGSIPSD